MKYLVTGSSQLALPLAKPIFAHLPCRLHDLLALRANLIARMSKSAGDVPQDAPKPFVLPQFTSKDYTSFFLAGKLHEACCTARSDHDVPCAQERYAAREIHVTKSLTLTRLLTAMDQCNTRRDDP